MSLQQRRSLAQRYFLLMALMLGVLWGQKPLLAQYPILQLDSVFNANVVASVPVPGSRDFHGYGNVALQPDGKMIYLGGTSSTQAKLIRRNPDGTVDNTFQDAGLTFIREPMSRIGLQSTGKIIVANTRGMGITRLNQDGSIDNTFIISQEAQNFGQILDMLVLPNDKIMFGGNGLIGALIRLNADGSVDSTFTYNAQGQLRAGGSLNGICLLPDGRCLVGLNYGSYDGQNVNLLCRILADGRLDTTFVTHLLTNNGIRTISLHPSGKYYVGGAFPSGRYGGNPAFPDGIPFNDFLLLDTNGAMDVNFATASNVASGVVWASLVQPDGKLVAAGAFDKGALRLNLDGSIDSTFNLGSGGFGPTIWGVTMQPDGKLLLAGSIRGYYPNHPNPDAIRTEGLTRLGTSLTSVSASAVYSTTAFVEAPANNGSIAQTGTITLTNDLFLPTGVLTPGVHYTATGVPAGLTMTITKTSQTTAQIAFTGNATAHQSANNASVVLTFLNDALYSGRVAGVTGLSPKTLTITFDDNAQAAASAIYTRTLFSEAASNIGVLSPTASTATISLFNATFVPTGALVAGTHYTATGVPAGLTLVLTRTSPTTVALSFTGAASAHAVANNTAFSLTFLDAAVSNGNAASVTGLNRSPSVQFIDPYTAVYSGLVFDESDKNDGSIVTKQLVTLSGTTFRYHVSFPTSLYPSQYSMTGVPSGLIPSVRAISPTVAEISFTGTALQHTAANNANVTLTFTHEAVTNGNVAGVQGLTPVTLSLRFRNPYTAQYSDTTFTEAAANNGTVTTTRTVTLSGDSFTTTPLVAGTHFTATGVPSGLTLSLVRTNDSTAQLSFTGAASAHAAANNASVVLSFLNAAVVKSASASSIVGLTPKTLRVLFQDPVVVPPPSSPNIVGFTPQVGTNGTVVTITGFGFTGTQNVLFGGAPAKSYTVVSDSIVTAVVDYGSTGDVTVVNPQGFGILPGFTFVPRPTISSFTPTTGNQGQVVTINGANFRGTALNGTNWTTTSVYFGAVPATSFTVISATQIQATVGAGATGAVRVETLPGNVGTRTGFCYMAPLITAFAPTSASTGTQVVITGSNFTGATAVRFNGRAAASYTVVSDTEIRAFPAAGTPITGSISVTTPQCTDDLATFTFIPAPVIYGFWLSGGTNGDVITIDGINFDNASAVKFGDTVAASYTVVSPTRITAVVGNGKTGAVSVIGPGGVGSRSKFIYYAPGAGRPNPPIITSFSPTQGPDGTVVTINGLNFQGTDWFTTAVRIGDAPDGPRTAIIQSMTPTRLVVRVNGGATGAIRVYTPAGVTTSTQTFTYFPPPTISSFTPTNGPAGTVVTITGTEFSGVSSVKVGGVNVSAYTVVSPTQITATVASGNSGRVTVVAQGGTATSAGNFTFPTPPPAPTLSTFSPAIATTGTVVTINGSNFTGATAVSFGGTAAQSFTVVNSGRITAVVGAGASGNVSVTTPGGSASKSGFTYLPKPLPTITSFSPASATVGQTVTINGTYFTGATQVFMGSASVPFTVVNSSRITVVVPANAASGVIRVVTPNGVALRPGFTFVPMLAFSKDGSASHSNASTAVAQEREHTLTNAELLLFPNPVSSALSVQAALERAATVRLSVVNVLGVVVWSEEIPSAIGTLERSLDMSALPAGSYMLELRAGTDRKVQRFVKR